MYIKKYKIEQIGNNPVDSFLKENREELLRDVVAVIKYCVVNGIDKMEAFIIEPSDATFVVYKENFVCDLKNALVFFEKIEDYECCIEIQKTLKKII